MGRRTPEIINEKPESLVSKIHQVFFRQSKSSEELAK